MGQKGSKKLSNKQETEVSKVVDEVGQSTIRTSLIIVGKNEQEKDASFLKDCLETSASGRMEVHDLEDVQKSTQNGSFEEKLKRYWKNSTGIILFCSEEMTKCLNEKSIINFTYSNIDFSLNGEVISGFLDDASNRAKVIPLTANRDYLPTSLAESESLVMLPEGEIDEDRMELICNEIKAKLEILHFK